MKNRLYNVIFPIWFMIIFPTVWIIILPANFIIDSLVLLISLKILKSVSIKRVYKSSIFKVWIFGFISDIIGSLLLILTQLIPQNNDFIGKVINSVALNPFNNIFSLIIVVICVLLSMFFIYMFNYKFSFKKTDLDDSTKKKLALTLAIFTAPYIFLVPAVF